MRFLPSLLFILFVTLPLRLSASDVRPGAVSISFDHPTQMKLLPRRSHQMLKVTSYNIRTLDATILHAPEPDTLAALSARAEPIPPPEAAEVWHGQLKATSVDGQPARADEKAVTAVDALGLVPALQPGVYYLVVKSRDEAQAVQPFFISNLGIQAFTGADGAAAMVRLLSEAKPAQNVEVALISGNNREIARIRTGADGVARFDKGAVGGSGMDAPAAMYAYGADGEFSAVSLDGGSLLGAKSGSIRPNTWIALDRKDYKAGEPIHGIALIRQPDGKAFSGTATAGLIGADGSILEQQPLSHDRAISGFTLHAPPANTPWLIRVETADGQEIGNFDPLQARQSTTSDKIQPGTIQLGAGRRTFQAGETANISIQPPETSEVTLAVIDQSVHAVMVQHIEKAGGVMQIPLPADAAGGVFLFASATTAPDDASGVPIYRSYGLQWLEIDEGSRRAGVRLDLPDSAEAGGTIPVRVTLSDDQSAKADYAVIGTAADKPSGMDPFDQLYVRRAPSVGIYEDYSMLASSGPALQPDLAALLPHDRPSQARVLLWTGVEDAPGGSANPLIALPDTVKPGRLRLSVIAANDGSVGFAESGIDIKATTDPKPSRAKTSASKGFKSTELSAHGTLSIAANHIAIITAPPIVAAPLWVSTDGHPNYLVPSDPDALELTRDLAGTVGTKDLVLDLLLTDALELPASARAAVRRKLTVAIHSPDYPADEIPIALYALYHGDDLPLWAEPMLAAPLPSTASWLVHLCRYGLTGRDADLRAIPRTEDSDDLETQIVTVLIMQAIDAKARKVALPSGLLEEIATQAFRNDLDGRMRLGLKAIQANVGAGPALRPEWDAAPSIRLAKDHPAVAVVTPSGSAGSVVSTDKRVLHVLVLSHWPDTPPE